VISSASSVSIARSPPADHAVWNGPNQSGITDDDL
jgi:hypothetical protein